MANCPRRVASSTSRQSCGHVARTSRPRAGSAARMAARCYPPSPSGLPRGHLQEEGTQVPQRSHYRGVTWEEPWAPAAALTQQKPSGSAGIQLLANKGARAWRPCCHLLAQMLMQGLPVWGSASRGTVTGDGE